MPTVNYSLPISNRSQMRHDLISLFLNELPGTGNSNLASRYTYNVEAMQSYSVYLKRPTRLNKGFDFTVNIGDLYFKKQRQYSNPSHQDIIDALLYCNTNFSTIYQSTIKSYITDIYQCIQPPFTTLCGANFLDYQGKSHPIEIILLALKWLFIEQDCAYWNYSGRAMLYGELQKHGLV